MCSLFVSGQPRHPNILRKDEDATNVRVEDITTDGVSGERGLSGILVRDSQEVSVTSSTINITSPGQSAGIGIRGAESANITLQDNEMYDTYGVVSDALLALRCSAARPRWASTRARDHR